MAIGTSLNYSVAAVGTTVSSVSQQEFGRYAKVDYLTDAAGVQIPLTFDVKASPQTGSHTQISGVMKFNPAKNDASFTVTQGRFTASFSVNYQPGTALTPALAKTLVKYFVSLLIQDAVYDSLVSGSL